MPFLKRAENELWKYTFGNTMKPAEENQDWEMSLRPGKREFPERLYSKSPKAAVFREKAEGTPSALAMRKSLVKMGE